MDPLSVWLAGSVVLPDAYERIVNSLGTRSVEDRLAKGIREQVGSYPKNVFRRWYRTPETWEALVRGGQESFDALVDRLVAMSADSLLGSDLSRDRAEAIVRAAVTDFMGTLDAPDAVDVADYRSAQRDRTIDENAQRRSVDLREHLDERFDRVETRLDGGAEFERRVSMLPAPTRPFFRALGATKETMLLLDLAAVEQPREALVQLTADLPPWLRDASGATLVAAAELCRSYRVHLGAGQLFELAGDRSADRGYLYARAAVEFGAAEEDDRANELIGRAAVLSTSTAVTAIAAALADDRNAVLEVLPADEALQDPYLVLVHMWALQTTSSCNDLITFLTSAVERYPESSGLMIELAWAYLNRSREAATASRTADRHRAFELGLEARDLRRAWRSGDVAAVRVACQAGLLLGAFDRVIQIGLAPPRGEALPLEAEDPEVRLCVAQAAIARGDLELVPMVADLEPQGFNEAIIRAGVLAHTDASAEAVVAAFDSAWAQATEEEHRVAYWLSASAAGVDVRGSAELRARVDDVPLLVDAQMHLSRAEYSAAVTLLRRNKRSEHTARLLVNALLGVGDIDGAVEELKIAATRFNESSHLVRAVEILGSEGRLDDAAAIAEEALQRVPRTLTDARTVLHEVLVERAGRAGEWGETAVRSRAWIDDLGNSSRNRWHLALALFNGGDRAGGWRIVQEPPALEPTTASEARLWSALAAHEAPSPTVAERIVALVDAFPDDKPLSQTAIALFFGRGDDVWGEIPIDVVTRYQELLKSEAVDFDSGQDAAVYVVTGTPEEMLEKLRPSLEANAQAINEMAEKVREGWPYGLLARVGHRPYAAALIHRAAGCLPIATIHADRATDEMEMARVAFDAPVAVDVSTLVMSGHLRALWPQLRAAFQRLEVPRPAHQDILSAVEGFRMPSHGTLHFDSTVRAVRGSENDPVVQDCLLDHAEWLMSEVQDVVVVDWPRLVELNEEFDATFLPWLSALDMAKARRLPLWCDDLGVRTLAANDEIPTFGTTALIAALVASGMLDSGAAQTALRGLRQEYAVDLPLDADWLRWSAASDEWRPGPATFYFTRQAAWLDFDQAYAIWSELAQSAASAEPIRVAGWVHAAAHGICGAVVADKAPAIVAGMAARGVAAAELDGEALAACAARVREVALAAGLQNPVPAMIALLLRYLTTAVGPDAAARLLMSPHLAEADRAVVRDLVLGLSSHPGPSESSG